MKQKEQPIEIGDLVKQAKELNCSISLNFAQHTHEETVEADGVFIANFMPIDDEQHPVKSIWGYWSEGYRLSGGTTLRLFTLPPFQEPEQISDCEFAPLEWYQEEGDLELKIDADWLRDKIKNDPEPESCEAGLTFPDEPINPFAGYNGISEEDFRPLKEGEDYTLELSDVDQQALDNVFIDLLDNHGIDGRAVINEMIEHEKKNDLFDAYDRAKKDLEE